MDPDSRGEEGKTAGVSHVTVWEGGRRERRKRLGGWARLASDQVAPISFSVAFTPSERSATLEGRSPVDGRMITMEMR